MKFLWPIILILSISSSFANSNCTPKEDSCDYYLCLEEEMRCGYKGFPLRYGYKFCQNFLDINTKSEELKNWLDKTRICLQESLDHSDLKQCSTLLNVSVKDHVKCYIDNGYCDLQKRDRRVVKKLIIQEFLTAPIYIIRNAKEFFRNKCPNIKD
jgi:hypothetical protein